MNLCVECGHDYDQDGRWAGFAHYVKNSDPALGFFRPICNEGVPYVFSPEVEAELNKMSEELSARLSKTMQQI